MASFGLFWLEQTSGTFVDLEDQVQEQLSKSKF